MISNIQELFNQVFDAKFCAGDTKNKIEEKINREVKQISEESFLISDWPLNNVNFNFYINDKKGLWAISQTIIIIDHDLSIQSFDSLFRLIVTKFGDYIEISELDGTYRWEGDFVNDIWKIRLKNVIVENYSMINTTIEFNTSPAYNYKN
jgi:hypothetical protein